ncbi:MAG: Gfo/Idh/MocA family oxidoreductase [Clostridiales bacterium]|nr:Gfo/Idh/MocA family oxidoreductase [Clostridiales bacterium]MDY5513769.1 Gfo/Idh/MocA family oxidoreductase [Candidatus Ventricola sp.]
MKTIRFAVVGLGAMGLAHAKTLLSGAVEEAELTAVVSGNEAHIAQLRACPGGEGVRTFASIPELAASGVCDAVLIATPHRLHVAQTLEAFDAGLAVLLEKPTGVYTAEVRALNEAADRCGLAFGVMFNQRTNPLYRRMHDIVASGELGEIRRTSLIITDWFRAQSYYDSGAWRATWKQDGGGVLLNQAPHNLDLWQWICGMPVRVHAFCGLGRWHDIEVEDDVTAYVEYANGATGTFITCTGEAPGTNRFEISMDGGQLVCEHGRLTLTRLSVPAGRFIREYAGGYGKPDVTVQDITPSGENPMHAGVMRAFARHMLYGEPMIADGREGLASLMLANAMLLSSFTGGTIALPMDEENDARYAQMLADRAASSRKRAFRPIEMDLGKSF